MNIVDVVKDLIGNGERAYFEISRDDHLGMEELFDICNETRTFGISPNLMVTKNKQEGTITISFNFAKRVRGKIFSKIISNGYDLFVVPNKDLYFYVVNRTETLMIE